MEYKVVDAIYRKMMMIKSLFQNLRHPFVKITW